MDAALVVCEILLAAVFSIAGLAKLAGQRQARLDASSFGVPQALAGTAVVGLSLGELGLGAGLLVAETARVAAIVGIALLLSGTALAVWNLTRGREADCGCFGSLKRARIGRRTITRDLLLAGVASFIALAGGNTDALSPVGVAAAFPLGAGAGLVGIALAGHGLQLARRVAAKRLLGRLAVELGDQPPLS